MDADRELEAVVAHGLLNSLAVISGSASTILQLGDALSAKDLEALTVAIDEQSTLFMDGLHVLIRSASDAFADAATAVALAAGVATQVDAADRALVLEALLRRSGLIRQALEGLVRGYLRRSWPSSAITGSEDASAGSTSTIASTRISVFSELAMKHSRWATSTRWSTRSVDVPAATRIRGRRTILVRRAGGSASGMTPSPSSS